MDCFTDLLVCLAVVDIQQSRVSLGLLTPLNFYLFGTPVSRSPSPLMHNTAFNWCSLPHKYQAVDADSIETVKSVIHEIFLVLQLGALFSAVSLQLASLLIFSFEVASPSDEAISMFRCRRRLPVCWMS